MLQKLATTVVCAVLSVATISPRAATAGEAKAAVPPSPLEAIGDLALDGLTGRDIYERVLANRFHSYIQESSLISGDEAGNKQETRLRMWFKSFRDPETKEPFNGTTLSKSIVKYLHPFDIRHSGYLVINNLDRPSDQFVYRASSRRVRRVNLRGEAVFGTDFSFEDVIPRELEDAEYFRLDDVIEQGKPCFVVRARPNEEMRSEYSHFDISIEKERYVPLRTRYWDDREIQIKEMHSPVESIQRIEGVWVPMHSTMTNTRLESYTTLEIDDIQPNVEIQRASFDLRRLETH